MSIRSRGLFYSLLIAAGMLSILLLSSVLIGHWDQCTRCGLQRYEHRLLWSVVSEEEYDEWGTRAAWRRAHGGEACTHDWQPASITERWPKGWTPLQWAAAINRVEEVGKLIESKPEWVNHQDAYGRTPLHWAYARADDPVIRLLLDATGDPHVVDEAGRTPADWYPGDLTVKFDLSTPDGADSDVGSGLTGQDKRDTQDGATDQQSE
jgi:hypothetical protein